MGVRRASVVRADEPSRTYTHIIIYALRVHIDIRSDTRRGLLLFVRGGFFFLYVHPVPERGESDAGIPPDDRPTDNNATHYNNNDMIISSYYRRTFCQCEQRIQ